MATPTNALRKAIVTALNNDSATMALVTGVFDYLPPEQPFDYIQVGEIVSTPQNVLGKKGHDTHVTFHIYSNYLGYQKALNILAAMDSVIDQHTLTLDAPFTHVQTMYVSHQELEEPDGLTRHVPAIYAFFTQGG